MALKTFVKINSVNNLSDARYCSGMGVDVIGFNIDPQEEGSVAKETFEEITSWVSGPAFAIETANSIDNIEHYKADFIESTNLAILNTLENTNKKSILKTDIGSANDLVKNNTVDYILIEGEGDLNDVTIELLKSLSSQSKVLLGYGFDARNLNDILDKTQVHGIAITAGEEIRPGYKDYDELADILEALEIDEWA